MKKFLFVLLTTLLVNAMPLQAAYATADDAQEQGCSNPYKVVISDEVRQEIKKQGGTLTELEGVRALAFQNRVEDLVGQKAPFTSNRIVLVNPDGEADTMVNVAYFADDCLVAVSHLPQDVVEKFLSPLEKKPGERVD